MQNELTNPTNSVVKEEKPLTLEANEVKLVTGEASPKPKKHIWGETSVWY